MNRLYFDTDIIANPEVGGLGVLHIDVPDDKVMAYMEALTMLGVMPAMELV